MAQFKTLGGATVTTSQHGASHQWKCGGCDQGQVYVGTAHEATTKANTHAGQCRALPTT